MKIYTVIERVDDDLRPYSYYDKKQARLGMINLVEEYFEDNGLDLGEYLAEEKEELESYGYKTCSNLEYLMTKNRAWFEDGSRFVAWELFETEIYEEE